MDLRLIAVVRNGVESRWRRLCAGGEDRAEEHPHGLPEQRSDPAWVAARRAEEREDELAEAASRRAQRTLLADLATVGVNAEDVYDLPGTPGAYPAAIPVLVQHLRQDHDDGILEGIARALGVTGAAPHWDEVMELFRATDPDRVGVHHGLGAALSQMATRALLPQVRAAVRDETLGPARVLFLSTLQRLRAPDRWELLEEMRDDPTLGPAAAHALHQRELRAAAERRGPDTH